MTYSIRDRHLPHTGDGPQGDQPINHYVTRVRAVDELFIHTIEGSIEGADAVFRNPGRNASTHDGIPLEGGEVWQWVLEHETAWGARGHNANAHHIENEGFARNIDKPRSQLDTLAERIKDKLLDDRYKIPGQWAAGPTLKGVNGHGDVDPSRRWDPGYIDVGYLTWKLLQLGISMGWPPTLILKAASPVSYPESMLVHYVQGVVKVAIDGLYGPITAEAVKRYQASIGVDADGIWGPNTWNAHIRRVVAALDERHEPPPEPEPDRLEALEATVAKLQKDLDAAHSQIRQLAADKAGVGHQHKVTGETVE